MRHTGRCYCGAVHYDVDGPFAYALNCHCSQCRRRTGSAFKPFAGIARTALRVTRGEGDLAIHGTADNNHTSCARCGALLFSVVQDGARDVRHPGPGADAEGGHGGTAAREGHGGFRHAGSLPPVPAAARRTLPVWRSRQ